MSQPLNHRDHLLGIFSNSPIQRTLGTTLRYEPGGEAVVCLPAHPNYNNLLGSTHGGIVATLLDTAGWFAAALSYDTWIVTVDLHVQFLMPASSGVLIAEGQLTRAGTRLATTRMCVKNEKGSELALGQGTFSVSSKPITE